jgi:hypothetical protein
MRWLKRILPTLATGVGLRSFLPRFSLQSILMAGLLPVVILGPVRTIGKDATSRIIKKKVSVVANHWQLAQWSNGNKVCDLFLKHASWPTQSDVGYACGSPVLAQWNTTPACPGAAHGVVANCTGLFLRYIGTVPMTYTEEVQLPGIEIRVNSLNCTPGIWCTSRPYMEIVATEPLSGYQIRTVHVRVGNQEKIYNGNSGRFNLPLTDIRGSWLEYWADSSYGDQSDTSRVLYRNTASKDGTSFHLDLLDNQWSRYAPSGALLWKLFPPVDGTLPQVLIQPQSADQLATSELYLYLGGYLIQSGKIDASNCPDGGLYIDGSASPCGVQAGANQITAWQNQYDSQIFQAALKYNVPARVLKGIIAQESQFWPTTGDPYELGLGYITPDGVDMLLQWNIPYYLNVCLSMYTGDICSPGYANLSEIYQNMIRKAVLDKVGSPEEIDILAAIVLASATQSGQLVSNVTGQEPMYSTDYIDLWKITIGNYYAGAGCLEDAMKKVVDNKGGITWDAVAGQLSNDCQMAKVYVDRVINNTGNTLP